MFRKKQKVSKEGASAMHPAEQSATATELKAAADAKSVAEAKSDHKFNVEAKSATPVMDASLQREFELFKMRKILKRSELAFLAPAPRQEALKTALSQLKTYGFGGVLTLPSMVALFSKSLDKTALCLSSAISYPHGEEGLKTKQFSAKVSLAAGASGLLFVANLSPVKRGECKQVRKEGEKLTALFSKKAAVKFAVNIALLTEGEREKLFRTLKGAKIKKIVLFSTEGEVPPTEVVRVKELCALPVDVLGNLSLAEEVFAFMESGAESVLSSSIAQAAESIAATYNVTTQQLSETDRAD